MTKIKALTDADLIKQASDTANQYMIDAIRMINSKLGDGYAQAHPELIAAFMQTAAHDYQTSQLQRILEDIRAALDK